MRKVISFGIAAYVVFSFFFPVVDIWVAPEIVGVIQDATTGKPIEGARIIVEPKFAATALVANSSESGVFLISPIADARRRWPGDPLYWAVLHAHKDGFKGVSTAVAQGVGYFDASKPAPRFCTTFFLVPLDSELDSLVEVREEMRVSEKAFTFDPVIRESDW